MKQGRSRARGNTSRRHSTTPAVICLPQAKPPITPPRKEPESLRVFILPQKAEPLALAPVMTDAKPKKNGKKTPLAVDQASATVSEIAPASPAPLPRNRALAVQPRGLVVVVGQWLRKLVMKPKKAALTIDKASAKTQVRALRVEVAQLQRSLDQLMAQLKAAERGRG